MMYSRHTKGFSIVELMVTVGIFALITSVLLMRNSKFDDETLLQAAAYEVALSVRQAQNYGINVQGQGGSFDKPYGVYFETGTTSYVLFSDAPEGNNQGDGYYDNGEELQIFKFGRGFTVSRICSLFGYICTDIEAVSVLFRRPEPEAVITEKGGGIGTVSAVAVKIESPRGGSRYIVVRQTGQIAIVKDIGDPSQEEI